MARKNKRIAVIDLETDPFLYGRKPEPFAAGFFDGTEYREYWGDECVSRLFADLLEYKEPLMIFAHNGGKFDFFYFLEYLENPLKIINGRIVKAKFAHHELRDSYAAIPVPLAAYQKDEIDYSLFERGIREKHKADILHYLAGDCEYLYNLIVKFVERFGPRLTVAGMAINELQKFHEFARITEPLDLMLRDFYFGGRVQAFETGILKGKFSVYDVNSMYPKAMRDFVHPCGRHYVTKYEPQITRDGFIKGFGKFPYFLEFEGENHGALPVRTKSGLDFTIKEGKFFACYHEIRAALELNLIKIKRPIRALIAGNTISFPDFVDTFIAEKIQAKKHGNKANEIFAKLTLNSSYGKFAQNPREYHDWKIVRENEAWPIRGYFEGESKNMPKWELYEDHGEYTIWRRPTWIEGQNMPLRFLDVGIAASITSASRTMLLRALQGAQRPIYCDTDSIICERLDGVPIDPYTLGAWKFEGTGNKAAIAGKKMYALFDGDECIKLATKGARLSPLEVEQLCRGETVEWASAAPNFSLGKKEPKFVRRVLTRT